MSTKNCLLSSLSESTLGAQPEITNCVVMLSNQSASVHKTCSVSSFASVAATIEAAAGTLQSASTRYEFREISSVV